MAVIKYCVILDAIYKPYARYNTQDLALIEHVVPLVQEHVVQEQYFGDSAIY